MYTVNAAIESVDPGLLMHKFDSRDEVEGPNNVKKSGRHVPTAEDEAESGAYRIETGELCQPAEHIYQAMCKAASDFQVKGKGKKTYKRVVTGNVVVAPEFIGHGTKEYAIDARRVRIGRAAVVRRRPWLPKWKLAFTIQVLVKAGATVGIGDYRPRFGRFIVTRFE